MAVDFRWFEQLSRVRSVPAVRRLCAPDIARERLDRLQEIVGEANGDPASLRWHLDKELGQVNRRRRGGKASLMYATSLALLSDITAAGWVIDSGDGSLGISPPDPATVSKATVRAAL